MFRGTPCTSAHSMCTELPTQDETSESTVMYGIYLFLFSTFMAPQGFRYFYKIIK